MKIVRCQDCHIRFEFNNDDTVTKCPHCRSTFLNIYLDNERRLQNMEQETVVKKEKVPNKKYTAEQKQPILKVGQDGKSLREIYSAFPDISQAAIRRFLRRANISFK